MRVVTRLTGISADTIRVWERRYGAVEPGRTEGKTRRFSARDVRRLVLLKQATQRGHRIKNIARLSEDELAGLVDQEGALASLGAATGGDPSGPDAFQRLVQDYLGAIMRFELDHASEMLNRSATLLQREAFLYQVVLPILRQTGERWHRREFSPAHEHLVSAQVRGLLDAILRLSGTQPGSPKILVTTPAGHLHEFGVLMGALIAASRGLQVIYLGPNLPEEDILLSADLSQAEVVLLGVVVELGSEELEELNRSLQRMQKRVSTWVGLPEDHAARGRVRGVRYFSRFEDLDTALTDLVSRQARRG
jgi:DNA-binding transcriptional MerR regulator